MTELNKWSICRSCLGCNQLELDNFKGVGSCINYIRGTNGIYSNRQDNWKRQTKNKF